jgi:hypothetical protein
MSVLFFMMNETMKYKKRIEGKKTKRVPVGVTKRGTKMTQREKKICDLNFLSLFKRNAFLLLNLKMITIQSTAFTIC